MVEFPRFPQRREPRVVGGMQEVTAETAEKAGDPYWFDVHRKQVNALCVILMYNYFLVFDISLMQYRSYLCKHDTTHSMTSHIASFMGPTCRHHVGAINLTIRDFPCTARWASRVWSVCKWGHRTCLTGAVYGVFISYSWFLLSLVPSLLLTVTAVSCWIFTRSQALVHGSPFINAI